MKTTILATFSVLLLNFAPVSNTKAQADPKEVILIVGEGIKIMQKTYQVIRYVAAHWTKVMWVLKGMHHTWWYVAYQDGFKTYNNFRSYRTPDDAYNYFVLGHGDCDARYFDSDGSTLIEICYSRPEQAKRYTDHHGPIVDMGFQGSNGINHSLSDY